MPCLVCQGEGHRVSRCPCLHDPLKEGFYAGGGGGGGHSHDDDDERAKNVNAWVGLTEGSGRIHSRLLNSDQNDRLLHLLRRCDGGHGPHHPLVRA